jgi:hypothetical protein
MVTVIHSFWYGSSPHRPGPAAGQSTLHRYGVKPRVQQHTKPDALLAADRPSRVVSCDVVVCPGRKSAALKTTHDIKEMACPRRCCCSAIAPGTDVSAIYHVCGRSP